MDSFLRTIWTVLLLYWWCFSPALCSADETLSYHRQQHHRMIQPYIGTFVAPLPPDSHACGYPVNKYCSLSRMDSIMLSIWKKFAASAKMDPRSSTLWGMLKRRDVVG